MNKREIEATEKMAVAMEKLADRLEKFLDPVVWQKTISDAVRMIPAMATPVEKIQQSNPIPGLPDISLPQSIQSISVQITLSEDEREIMINKIHESIKPQLAEFAGFVENALKDMPPHRLKKISDQIDQGNPPKLERRKGCVFITAGDEESYLGL